MPNPSDLPILCDVSSNPIPEGAHAGFFNTSDQVRLRYAHWPKSEGAPKGTICIAQGRAEFIEKYFETIEDLRARGFCVATFDFRGQGGSERLIGNKKLGYVAQFADYVTDLKSFHTEILLPDCPPPYYMLGHSTGGLIALHAAAENRMMFDRLFLSSPFLGIENSPISISSTARLASMMCFFGLGHVSAGRKGDATPSAEQFVRNKLTSDTNRYMRMVDVLTARPDLITGAPSIRWVASAFQGIVEASNENFPAQLNVPILMLAAARDEIASAPAIEQLGLRLRTGRHLVIPAARHELLMENDTVRAQVFAAFDAFITNQSE